MRSHNPIRAVGAVLLSTVAGLVLLSLLAPPPLAACASLLSQRRPASKASAGAPLERLATAAASAELTSVSSSALGASAAATLRASELSRGSGHPLCDAATLAREVARTARARAPESAVAGRGSATAAVVCIIGAVPDISFFGGLRSLWQSHLFTPQFVTEFESTFDDLDAHFLAPFRYDHVLLFQRGAGLDCALLAAAHRLGWLDAPRAAGGQVVGGSAFLCALLHAGACADRDFWTPRGTRVRVRARDFALPLYLQQDPSLLDAPGWRECEGQQWSLGYTMYSGAAYAHHVFIDDLLASYDFTFKVDADVRFHRRPPADPVAIMRERRCVMAHTAVLPGSLHASCQRGAFAALQRFSKLSGSLSASAGREWCAQAVGPDYFFGNFMGGASSFLRSKANALLNTWLYECDEGYFRSRWGDQASPALYLCHWLDVPSLQGNATPHICDFSDWRRNGVFEHSKAVV